MEWREDMSGIAFEKASPEPPCETFENGVGDVWSFEVDAGNEDGRARFFLQDAFLHTQKAVH